ncbi:MAG: recombination protein RecR [Planctomycetes bacterium]|nr:recombination protein RecR [Planctomycetota bacterium]
MAYPKPLERLIAAFERFPGIGRRSAERMAFHVLRDPEAMELAVALRDAAENTRRCGLCHNVTEQDPCALCADPARDASQLLVVEEPRDVEAVERSQAYRGRYHVLLGAYNPAEGTEEKHLTVAALVKRLAHGGVNELILATDPDAEGEATALVVLAAVDRARLALKVTRLARGVPAGSALEYLHKGVIQDALSGRIALRERS